MSVTAFSTVKKPEQFIIDMRSAEEKEMIRQNQKAQTFKLSLDVYQDRA